MLLSLYKLSLSSTLSLLYQYSWKICCHYLQGTCDVICTIQEPGTQQAASTLFLSVFKLCQIHALVKTMTMQRQFSAVPPGKCWDKPWLIPSTSLPSHYLSKCRLYNDISVVVVWLHALHTLIQYTYLLHVIPTRRAATKNTLVNMMH